MISIFRTTPQLSGIIKNGSDSSRFFATVEYFKSAPIENVLIMEWKRDWGLTSRVWLTGLLLLLLYLVFMTMLLFIFPSASIWLFVILAVGMGLVQYFFSDKLVLWSTGARIIEEDEYPELHRTVEKLCKEADLPKPKIAIMQSPVPNAFATGRSPKHAVVACTDSIMRLLTRDELEAVLAHELAHVKNRDILTMTMARISRFFTCASSCASTASSSSLESNRMIESVQATTA